MKKEHVINSGSQYCFDENHSVFTSNKDWIKIKDLEIGDSFKSLDKSNDNYIVNIIKKTKKE